MRLMHCHRFLCTDRLIQLELYIENDSNMYYSMLSYVVISCYITRIKLDLSLRSGVFVGSSGL